MSNEGNKNVLISMPYGLWVELKRFINSEEKNIEMKNMSEWIRELIKNELNKQNKE